MTLPNTRVRTSHGMAIKVGGVTVGLIQTWNYALTKDVTPVYELNPLTSGKPVDNVPGNVRGLTIDVSRVDLYNRTMEEAFGTNDLAMLTDQTNPFDVHETWINPDGSTKRYIFVDCWFSRIQRRLDVGGNRIVVAEGTLVYKERKAA